MPPLTEEHYLHHFPKDDRGEFCAKGLGTKTPAYGSVADDYVNEVDRPREIVVQDTLQVSKPDIHGNHWYQVSEDVYSEYPRIEPHMTKEAEVVWDATAQIYPGTRFEQRPKIPAQFSVDNGTEYKGVFKEKAEERGSRVHYTTKRRSKSNARAERTVGEAQRRTVPALLQSRAPASWHSYAAKQTCFNESKLKVTRRGLTPWEVENPGKKWTGTLFPFGARIDYLFEDTDRDKFDGRRAKAMRVAYTHSGEILCVDFNSAWKSAPQPRCRSCARTSSEFTPRREQVPLKNTI